jgi:putative transposase
MIPNRNLKQGQTPFQAAISSVFRMEGVNRPWVAGVAIPMPRTARVVVPEVALHVCQRGNNRLPCFLRAADYRLYLSYLRAYAKQYGCAVHAYCLMTNHVHLLLTPAAPDSCAKLMKRLGQCYVQTINRAHGRTGTLWEGRFHSCLVPTERYVLACYRYIELNPVRAGLVASPEAYPWSSFLANAQGKDGFISRHPALEAVGNDYRGLFDVPIEAKVLDEIRAGTRNGYALGVSRRRRGQRKPVETGTDPISAEIGSVPISGQGSLGL